MKFLNKRTYYPAQTPQGWIYPKDQPKILDWLMTIQKNFCAYTEERKEKATDLYNVEHFDPRLKGTDHDGFDNWYGVLQFHNNRRPRKIEKYLPLPNLNDPTLTHRIEYREGFYFPKEDSDQEVKNLSDFLNLNEINSAEERDKYIKNLRGSFATGSELLNYFQTRPEKLRFPTAVEAEFGISLDEIIFAQNPRQ